MTMFQKNKFGKILNFNFYYKFLLKKPKIEYTATFQSIEKRDSHLRLCLKKGRLIIFLHCNFK
jgi:hypothetical protein